MLSVIWKTTAHFLICIMSCSFNFKVSNDLDKYLLRYSIFNDCLEQDAHDMTSQILSILIDFTQDRAISCTIFWIVFQTFKP